MPVANQPQLRASMVGHSSVAVAAKRYIASAFANWRYGRLRIELPHGDSVELRGVEDDGATPRSATIVVRSSRLFARALLRGEIGIGESYVAGEWNSPDLTAALRLVLRNLDGLQLDNRLSRLMLLPERLRHRARQRTRLGGRARAARNIHAHYDLGNAYYQRFLDPAMLYSCAIFDSPTCSLKRAQRNKLDAICRALNLGESDHLLDIGCGWGGLAIHAAREFGCTVTGITLSRQQLQLACQRVAAAGLSHRVHIRYADYRDLAERLDRDGQVGKYSKVASIEMIEAVGPDRLPTFFDTIDHVLAPGGKAVVQAITMDDARVAAYSRSVDWMQVYVFPGSFIPSPTAIERALQPTRMRVVSTSEIGPHYAPTLRAWRDALDQSVTADALPTRSRDERFARTWRLYLAFSEASFAEGTLGVQQLRLSRSEGARTSAATSHEATVSQRKTFITSSMAFDSN